MWPVLTPAQLLHDLFGSTALLRLAADGDPRGLRVQGAPPPAAPTSVDDVRWTAADVALLDEAREVLGPEADARAASRTTPRRSAPTATS